MEHDDQALGNIPSTYIWEESDYDYQDSWSQILADCPFDTHSTNISILDTTPAQTVLGKDMLS